MSVDQKHVTAKVRTGEAVASRRILGFHAVMLCDDSDFVLVVVGVAQNRLELVLLRAWAVGREHREVNATVLVPKPENTSVSLLLLGLSL